MSLPSVPSFSLFQRHQYSGNRAAGANAIATWVTRELLADSCPSAVIRDVVKSRMLG